MFDISVPPALVGGLAMIAIAVALLRSGWKISEPAGRLCICSGWLALLVSLYLLAFALGTAVGLTIATLAFGICGYGAVMLNSEHRPPRSIRIRAGAPDARSKSRENGWGRGFAAFLLVMVAAIAAGSAAAGLPIGLPVDRVTIGGIIVPVIWAGLIIWALSDARLRRPVLGLCGIIGAAGVLIAVEVLA